MRAVLILALVVPLQAQTQSASGQIGDITTQQTNGRIEVVISTNGNIPQPRVSRLADPERLVFNFTGAVPKSGYSRMSINQGPLSSARTSLFGLDGQGNPVTRVVLDLSRRAAYRTSNEPGKFIVSLEDMTSKFTVPAHVPTPAAVKVQAPPALQPDNIANTLNDISVSQAGGQTTISLKLSRSEKPRTMYLEAPRRFVLDFPGVGFGADWMKPPTLRVNSPAVTAIRSSLFREQPPIVRVVFDQAEESQAPKMSVEGNTVVVQFSDRLRAPARPREPAPVHVRTGDPVIAAHHENVTAPDSTVPHTADTVPVPQPASASASIRPEAASGIAVASATVTFQDGLLTVSAENTMLIDVLYAIGEKTGAAMEVPMAEAMLDRVAIKIGPRRPREVIATMLEGSGFNYFIIENSAGDLQKVVLTPKEQGAVAP